VGQRHLLPVILLLLVIPLMIGCVEVEPDAPDVRFVDVSVEAGFAALGPSWTGESPCLREALGGGAAVGDVDGDGDLDVFLPRMYLPSQLLLNDGTGRFDLSDGLPELVGAANGSLLADLDGDRDLDLVVAPIGPEPVRLLVNDGAGGFVERADSGLPVFEGACADLFGVSAADVDVDGDLDLFLAGWKESADGATDATRLLHNDGRGRFTDATVEAGIDALGSRAAFGGLFADRDGDGDPDLHLVADWGGTGWLRNEGGRFTEEDPTAFTDENGMGGDLGDVDGDGDLDWFVTSVWQDAEVQPCPPVWGCSGNRLYVDAGDGVLVDDTDRAGVREGQWGWGAAFLDYDLDGRLDLAMTGGMDVPGFEAEPGRIWRGLGDGTFVDVTEGVGFVARRQGRGLVPFDADGDGDLDLLVTGSAEPPSLWLGTGAEGQGWLSVTLDQSGSNRWAVGARVEVAGQVRIVSGNPLFVSGPPPVAHIGLGAARGPVDVDVIWPDGARTHHADVELGAVELRR
jgi:enediyne biosynthesis protein E4